MIKIRMKIDQKGSENGCVLNEYKKGLVYEMGDWLAGVFLKENWAERVVDAPEIVTPESIKKEKILTPEGIKKPKKKLKRN